MTPPEDQAANDNGRRYSEEKDEGGYECRIRYSRRGKIGSREWIKGGRHGEGQQGREDNGKSMRREKEIRDQEAVCLPRKVYTVSGEVDGGAVDMCA